MPYTEEQLFTVSDINRLARSFIEEAFPDVAVIGEVSNCHHHSSGHLYLTLKDAEAQLKVVCFRSDAQSLDFQLEDGLKVVAKGRLTVYEHYGQFQLVARQIVQAGVGELELAFKALCRRLEKEGLFDESHKLALPPFPFKVAVVTSASGAAVKDIVSNLHRRWPCAEILLVPVPVQGAKAAPAIIAALAKLARLPDVDLIILGRGGGSIEDLWAFNDENLARAIYRFPLPLVSAVGHERDFTIADFVADARAATPTMAAEIAVPVKEEVEERIRESVAKLARLVADRVKLASARLEELLRSYALGRVRGDLERNVQRVDYAVEKLRSLAAGLIEKKGSRLASLQAALDQLNPRAVLGRGYTLCTSAATGRVLSSVDSARRERDMNVTFKDGRLLAQVKEQEDERKE